VEIFPLQVTGNRRAFAERGARELVWLPAEQAVARVDEAGLKRILQSFCKARSAA
jgi:hypothetical protein